MKEALPFSKKNTVLHRGVCVRARVFVCVYTCGKEVVVRTWRDPKEAFCLAGKAVLGRPGNESKKDEEAHGGNSRGSSRSCCRIRMLPSAMK